MFFPEAKDIAQVEFYTFIATMIYAFLVAIFTFYIFYKIAMLSNNKGFKNLFLLLMSLLLRIPFNPVDDVTKSTKKTSKSLLFKEIWKELLIIFIATVWFIVGLFFANLQIQEFKGFYGLETGAWLIRLLFFICFFHYQNSTPFDS